MNIKFQLNASHLPFKNKQEKKKTEYKVMASHDLDLYTSNLKDQILMSL